MGFPSPATDYLEEPIDIRKILLPTTSTFVIRYENDAMIDAFIPKGSFLVIDRSLDVKSGDKILGVLKGEFIVRIYTKKRGNVFLDPANKKYKSIEVTEEMDFKVWGVITFIVIDAKV